MSRLFVVSSVYVVSFFVIVSETVPFESFNQELTKDGRTVSTKISSVVHAAHRERFTESSPLFFLHLLKHKQKIQRVERVPTTPPPTDCICVPYYLCSVNQTIITDGVGTIDIRFRRCSGELEVCCYLPNSTASMAPVITPTSTSTTKATPSPTTPTTPKTTPTTPTTPKTTPTTPTTPQTTPTTPTTPKTTPTTPTPPPIIFPTAAPTDSPIIIPTCVCVLTWQCDPSGIVGVSGEGVINPRQQYALCPSTNQVCCKLSSIIDVPINPPITSPPISTGQTQICILCGNTFQCSNSGIIIPGSNGVIDPRLMYQMQCSVPNTCCQVNSVGGNVFPNGLGPLKNPGTPQACYCVKSWLCTEGNAINLDGVGAIDPRFIACTSADEVCCVPTGIDVQTLRESTSGQGYIVNPGSSPLQGNCGVQNKTFAPAQPYPPNSGKTYFAEFPWMVALLTAQPNGQYLFQCGGSLISTTAVLTAAHCVINREIGKLIVRFGQWDLEKKDQPVPYKEATVKTIIAHPSYYSGGLFHDIAILILDAPVTTDINISPICLPSQGMTFTAGTRCYGSGWGRNSYGTDGKYQTELRKVDLPIVGRSNCQTQLRGTRLGQYFQLHGSFICAGGEASKDTCRGDGGGPLACPTTTGQFVQAGIVSWGIGCGTSNVPAVYTSVAQHRLWIDQQLATYGA